MRLKHQKKLLERAAQRGMSEDQFKSTWCMKKKFPKLGKERKYMVSAFKQTPQGLYHPDPERKAHYQDFILDTGIDLDHVNMACMKSSNLIRLDWAFFLISLIGLVHIRVLREPFRGLQDPLTQK